MKDKENTVKAAVESILEQDFPHSLMEIIVVEGASRDRTSSIVESSLRKSDIKYHIFQETTGLGMARQIVTEKSIGKYILWVDGDMMMPRDYLRMQVLFIENNSDVGIVGGSYAFHSDPALSAELENITYLVDSAWGKNEVAKFCNMVGTEGAVFRVNVLKDIGGFDTRIKGAAEDSEISFRMKAKGWQLARTTKTFSESNRQSWLSLWDQYVWYGKGGHFVFHKNCNVFSLISMTPVAGFIVGSSLTPRAYLITHKKSVFLLPSHFAFKRIAWIFGFLLAHLEGYGHFAANPK